MKIDKIIEEYGMDYITGLDLDVKRIIEISLEDAMHLNGRCVLIDKEQDIYSNDLPLDERRSALQYIFGK
jgi:hypothetical protein